MFCKRQASIRSGAIVLNMGRAVRFISELLRESGKMSRAQDLPFQIIRLGAVSPVRSVPQYISMPDYSKNTLKSGCSKRQITINNEETIRKMRQTCSLAKHILKMAGSLVEPGVTTDEIDAALHDEIIRCGAYPSTLHYKGFPKSCCTSVNNVVCHGVPNNTVLQSGDIINIDITVFYLGCHGDTSDTFKVGEVDDHASKLIAVTKEALQKGMNICKPGAKFSEIPHSIEPYANENGFEVCRRFVGHGIGEHFHSAPNIWHASHMMVDRRKMEPGMIFTIEPILMEGSKNVTILRDGWTAVSSDDLRSAQAEHTILITPSGHEVLTL